MLLAALVVLAPLAILIDGVYCILSLVKLSGPGV